jgi:exodeoxyribonuclease VII small subunit
MTTTNNPDTGVNEETIATQLTYEQARDELIEVVNRLESGTENLDESMKLFARGQELAGLCEKYLSDARGVVDATKGESEN